MNFETTLLARRRAHDGIVVGVKTIHVIVKHQRTLLPCGKVSVSLNLMHTLYAKGRMRLSRAIQKHFGVEVERYCNNVDDCRDPLPRVKQTRFKRFDINRSITTTKSRQV